MQEGEAEMPLRIFLQRMREEEDYPGAQSESLLISWMQWLSQLERSLQLEVDVDCWAMCSVVNFVVALKPSSTITGIHALETRLPNVAPNQNAGCIR